MKLVVACWGLSRHENCRLSKRSGRAGSRSALLTGLLWATFFVSWVHANEHPLFNKGVSAYKTFCSHCHGLNMVNPGTSSYDLRKWPLDKRDEFVDVLKNGKGSMPAWGDILLPEEIDALWVYVATRGGKEPFPVEDGSSNQSGDDKNDSASMDKGKSTQSPQTIKSSTLTACLPLNGGIMSGRRNGGSGFDFLVVEHIADRLELELDVVWFEAELEEENDPVRENYAMLSMGLCDVVPGHPVVEGALGQHVSDRAAPPRWVDKPVNWGHKQILLKPVEATRAYVRIEMGIVSHADAGLPADVSLAGLGDNVIVGLEQGTLAALLTQRQAPVSVVSSSRSYVPGPGFLWQLENRKFDAALIGIPAFDYHVVQNPISELKLSSYRHPLGFDIGMAVLQSADELRMQINSILMEAEESGKLTSLGEEAGLHYTPALNIAVTPRMNLEQLIADKH